MCTVQEAVLAYRIGGAFVGLEQSGMRRLEPRGNFLYSNVRGMHSSELIVGLEQVLVQDLVSGS